MSCFLSIEFRGIEIEIYGDFAAAGCKIVAKLRDQTCI